jgi:frataxin
MLLDCGYIISSMDATEFRRRADAAIEDLKQSLIRAEDQIEMEAEENAGALHITFDDPPGKFVITPNAPVAQIWISALVSSFKLDWSESAHGFVFPKTGERLKDLVGRLIGEQLGQEVQLT